MIVSDARIEYGLLDEAGAAGMAALLADAFSRSEPPAVAVGLSAPEIRRLVSAFFATALAERLTIVARDAATGTVVGALLTEDFATPPPEGLEESVPRFGPIGALLDGLDRRYRESHPIEAGTHLHLFMLGVAPRFSGRGIASELVRRCLENGRALGYRSAVTEATGPASQYVFRKLGFRDLFLASYRDFRFEGKAVFATIENAEGTILMEREL